MGRREALGLTATMALVAILPALVHLYNTTATDRRPLPYDVQSTCWWRVNGFPLARPQSRQSPRSG
jgi:hypothetical protein